MEENILEKNLAQISRYNEKLTEKIRKHEVTGDLEFYEAISGDFIMSYNGHLLHDNTDPQEEAYEIFRKLPSNNKSTLQVLFGIGLGYLFKRLSLSCKGKIVLFEPNLDILKTTLSNVDFSEDFAKDNIILVQDINDIQKSVEKFFFGETEVNLSFLSSYSRIFPEIIPDLVNELGFIKGLYQSNYDNLFDYCYGWTLTGIQNIPSVMEHQELESLRNKFHNKPAVIISAGPSLTNNIGILKDYQDKAVTFCVGPALRTALNHDIKPDFLTVVEAQDCSFQVAGLDVSDLNLILQPMTFRSFHSLPVKRHFNYYPSNEFTTKWLAQHIDVSLEDYLNKGTVSLCAVFSAMIMGCNPIIIMGQDLAYTNGKCYSSGSPFQGLKCVKNEETGKPEVQLDESVNIIDVVDPERKYDPEEVEKLVKKRINRLTENLYTVKGQNGEMLFTESGYATFIRYFENVAAEYGNRIKFINSTEGGAQIEGFENISLKLALDNYAKENFNTETIIQQSLQSARNLLEEKGELIISESDKTIKYLQDSFTSFERGKRYTEKLIKLSKLNRLRSDSFKEYCREILASFIDIEQKAIAKSILILGLIYPQYSKFTNYLKVFNDNIDDETLKQFVELSEDFFIKGYEQLKTDLLYITSMRDRLNESCNTTSQKSVC